MAPVVGANVMAEAMARRGAGQIVLVGSIAESYPAADGADLCRHQGGAAPCSPKSLGMRMAKHGVTVTLVSPGFIDTPMSRQVHRAQAFPDDARMPPPPDYRARVAAATRRIVVPWQFAVMRALSRSAAARPAALGPVARMTAAPDLGPESGLLARLAASRAGRLRHAAAALGHSAGCCWRSSATA